MFQFPFNPTLDQTFHPAGGPTYKWNGQGWMPFAPVYNGGLTFTGPVLFADGTLPAPGIGFANLPSSGIWRDPATHDLVFVYNSNPFLRLNPGYITVQPQATFNALLKASVGVYLPVNAALIGQLPSGATGVMALAGGDARIHIGYSGWTETMLDSAGTLRVHVHAGGTAFYGNVTGITAAMVGLGNVYNRQQIQELWPGQNNIYIGYSGGTMHLQVDGTYFATTWPMHITGNSGYAGYSGAALRLYANASTGAQLMTFWWVGQGGTPGYVWGSHDGVNMYVFYPGQMTVGNATNAAYAQYLRAGGAADGAGMPFHWVVPGGSPAYVWGGPGDYNSYIYLTAGLSVGYAANSGQICGIGGWRYTDVGVNVTYVWATGGNSQDNYLTAAANLSVNYANSCATAQNSNQVNNIGGWQYSNWGNNPTYLWVTEGSTQVQHLTTPGALSVGYANSAGFATTAGTAGGFSGGRAVVYADLWYGGRPSTAYDKMQFSADSSSSSFPGYALLRRGVFAWSIAMYETDLLIGPSNDAGPGELNGWAMRILPLGLVTAWAFQKLDSTLLSVEPLTGALANVLQLRGVRGYDAHTERNAIGVESDAIKRLFPEAVTESRSETGEVTGVAIDYMALIAPIIEALRDVNQRLTTLEAKP